MLVNLLNENSSGTSKRNIIYFKCRNQLWTWPITMFVIGWSWCGEQTLCNFRHFKFNFFLFPSLEISSLKKRKLTFSEFSIIHLKPHLKGSNMMGMYSITEWKIKCEQNRIFWCETKRFFCVYEPINMWKALLQFAQLLWTLQWSHLAVVCARESVSAVVLEMVRAHMSSRSFSWSSERLGHSICNHDTLPVHVEEPGSVHSVFMCL